MLSALFENIFGCGHRKLSWPLTVRQPRKRTYVVCLRCGTEFDYDFETLQVYKSTRMHAASGTQHKFAG